LVEIKISSPPCLGHPQNNLRGGLDPLKNCGYGSRFRQQRKKRLPSSRPPARGPPRPRYPGGAGRAQGPIWAMVSQKSMVQVIQAASKGSGAT
jgi:hypothetical protein